MEFSNKMGAGGGTRGSRDLVFDINGDVSNSQLNARGRGAELAALWKSMKECHETPYC